VPPASASATLYFGHFELQPGERRLLVDGQPAALGGRAFDLLLLLARRPGQLVTKQELLDAVWPGLVVEEHNIATQVGTLRKLLGTASIETVPGRGYRLTTPPHAAPASAQAPGDPSPRHNLPESRTRFIGRDEALAGLARLLPPARLLTLTGIGGCGKTRLALQFARQQLAAFADGVWFIDLAPLKDASRVAAACAAVLGLRDDGDSPLLQRLVAHLGPRRSLLVLDNCEQVLDGAATLVDALLAGSAGSTILATSRQALGVVGEQVVPVRSLALPASDDLHAVLQAESARVFIDRARLASPDFQANDGNAAAIAEVCRRLDGIALALELAAARVPMLSVAGIAERLDDRFRLLTGGQRSLPRHQTLQAAIAWSYEQLSPQAQWMLRQVSVFAGGWALAAAAAVARCADEYEALTLLTELHDKSLILVDHDGAGGRPRYRMLETLRQYALERLVEQGEAQTARHHHAAHFMAWSERANQHVRGPEQDRWIAQFRQEHENLVAALGWCCEGPVDPAVGLRLAAATGYYWLWNSVESGHGLLRAALAHDGAATDSVARVETLNALARLSLFRGRYDESLRDAQEALAIARRLGAPRPLAQALDNLGSALNTLARIDEALIHHSEALEVARPLDDGLLTGMLLNNLAEARRNAGQLDAAEHCYHEALQLARRHGGRVTIVVLLNNLVRVLVALDRPDQARSVAIEGLALVGDEKVGVDLLEATVGLAASLGDCKRAVRTWACVGQTMREWGYRHQTTDTDHTAAWIDRCRRQLGDAAFTEAAAAGQAQPYAAALRDLAAWLAAA
jgi:non-specific serine/threonine protein kinase